jgi:hypothetical protein
MKVESRLLRTQRGCKMGFSSKRPFAAGKDTSCAMELMSMHVRGMALLQNGRWVSEFMWQAQR